MKFSEIPYVRPDVEAYRKSFENKIEAFRKATTAEEQVELWREINEQNINFGTNATLVQIRNSIDTKDEFYKDEQDFWDELGPTMEDLFKEFRRAVLDSQFRSELIEVFGQHITNLYELQEKTFSPEIVADMQEENKLVSEFINLIGGAEFEFGGEKHNLSSIPKFFSQGDRELRLEAVNAKFARYEKNDAKLNELYDGMVQIRHRMAKKLGYKDFVQYRYDELLRVDYNSDDIEKFRQYIVESVVPLCNELYAWQAKNIGVDSLRYHDEAVYFPEGNPKPRGSAQEILETARKMYHELSPETGEFIDLMFENELFDVEIKPTKTVGGYCTSLDAYKLPFIFSNFNGTTADIDVMTHEIGHGLQSWMSMQEQPLQQYHRPTSESAEIHSMGMEYITMPWMNMFFGEDTHKYEYLHLLQALTFAPYGCAVDEFQQRVYEQAENPTKTYEEIWKEMEEKYMPHRQYMYNPYLQEGNHWKQKIHIFEYPLYYIDYVLAQTCALQLWARSQDDFKKTWGDYVKLCKLGGSKSFLGLLKAVNLQSPFEPGAIEKTMQHARNRLKKNPL